MKWFLTIFLAMWVLLPQGLMAFATVPMDSKVQKTWEKFNDAVDSKRGEITQIAFGPVLRLLGAFGMAYGIISVFTTNDFRQLKIFAGAGFLAAILPTFIDTIFGAVLPGM